MRKEDLKNLTHTGHSEGKRDRREQSVTFLMSLNNWMVELVLEAIKTYQELQRIERCGDWMILSFVLLTKKRKDVVDGETLQVFVFLIERHSLLSSPVTLIFLSFSRHKNTKEIQISASSMQIFFKIMSIDQESCFFFVFFYQCLKMKEMVETSTTMRHPIWRKSGISVIKFDRHS